MKVFTYSEARQNLAKLLIIAQKEEVEIRRRDGTTFSLISKKKKASSPFDIWYKNKGNNSGYLECC